MSAPVLGKNGDVLAVIQISRKAPRPGAAGPDFTDDDLRKLESTAVLISRWMRSEECDGSAAVASSL